DTLSPFIHLQEKKKQDRQMQKILEEKEEDFRVRMEAIVCRWKDLQVKDAELKAYMQKSRRTLQENDKIRIRALKKSSKEREIKLQKESELSQAKKELEALKKKHKKLCDRVRKFSIFRKYLEEVVKVSQFEEIQAIIRRYKTLMRMRKDLLQAEQGRMEAYDQAKAFLVQYAEDKEEILQHNSEMAQLELCPDQAHSDVVARESLWDDIQSKATKKTLELGTIKMAILSLF
ncbi:CCD42 protein, partial [Alectura lathami]|nr:CCD42 protein [Alectura lathami]